MSENALAMRLPQLGTIRLGNQVEITGGSKHSGKPRQNKLDKFRITSNHHGQLQEIAKLYGGEVVPWEVPLKWRKLANVKDPSHSFEVYTTSDLLDVIVPSHSAVHTCREIWDAGGCAHRCDAETRIVLVDDDDTAIGAVCERDQREKEAERCEEVSRYSVILSEIHGMGLWRINTKGFYAAAETRGFFHMLNACQQPFGLEATLRLEPRVSTTHAKGTLKFVVPVLQPRLTPGELFRLASQSAP